MAAPVAAYVGVICAMVLSAVGTGDPRAVVGAALFAGSDSLIARERFVRPGAVAAAGDHRHATTSPRGCS